MFPSLLIIDKDLNEQEKNIEGPFQVILTTLPWVKKGEDQGCTMPSKSLGYKIKYIDPLPGHKLKRALYEIKPGHWVTKARVPEYKAKHWHHNNKWNNGEYGYIMNLYSAALKEFKNGRHGKGIPVLLKFTKETWWQHWLKQKAKYGMYCPYTKVLMTTVRGHGRGTHGGKRTPTNISRDRVLCSRKYSRQNLIFTTWEYNNSKHSITPKAAKAFLRIVRERYGTDEVE